MRIPRWGGGLIGINAHLHLPLRNVLHVKRKMMVLIVLMELMALMVLMALMALMKLMMLILKDFHFKFLLYHLHVLYKYMIIK